MTQKVVASGWKAIKEVEKGDKVTYKTEGQSRRKQPLEVVRTEIRSSRSGDKRKEMELHGDRGGEYLLSFSLSDTAPFEDALHINLSSANLFSPEEFYLNEKG